MDSPGQINSPTTTTTTTNSNSDSSCFFCNVKEPDPSLRRPKIAQFFKQIPIRDDPELVLVLSGLWNIAMINPDDSEFPSLGIFDSMAKLIHRGVDNKKWLRRDQNIYIPYYAAHIIGSYTMNKSQLAEKAVESGVVLALMELLRGKISWVEQRVAVRALGHLASHEKTFEAVAVYEAELVKLAMEISCSCLDVVYEKFIRVEYGKRSKYHCDLLTRGLGGVETENKKAEEWASQLQCWSLYLLNCFACKEMSLDLLCNKDFLKVLSGIWGGLVNRASPGGIGLIKTLCCTKIGREKIADLREVVDSLCNLSRSSDDWREIAIDCLLLLLKDPETRFQVMDTAALFLVDLVELGNLGDKITQVMLQDFHKIRYGDLRLKNKEAEKAVKEIWDLKVERRRRENLMSDRELKERESMAGVLKQEGNQKFWPGYVENSLEIYSEALELCTVKMRKERIVLHSNRAQCYLLLRKPEAAISDTTRALCLSSSGRPHGKSLWRRSQAYAMKGFSRESLMDCIAFINARMKSVEKKRVRIPYYAVQMINKQMNATWLFAAAESKNCSKEKVEKSKRKKPQNQNQLPRNSCLHE
ncbi:uncharacterized protein LOC110813551 [Carica papaya]|uniref:uncharacterized protein LOC110813551 n=1 Tax=Carica papaya TaxID=3649 RepID=UPI000B8CB0CF|nr:uncharacterized protein LOC110813551 [Carica papaya]